LPAPDPHSQTYNPRLPTPSCFRPKPATVTVCLKTTKTHAMCFWRVAIY